MNSASQLAQAEGELAEINGLINEQFGIITKLKRLGADRSEAVRLLYDLLELQRMREQHLAQIRLQRRRVTSARLRRL
jgi:hypothetical protein